jgi:TRAP-type C4-dicarboxylate transport system permease small subunit
MKTYKLIMEALCVVPSVVMTAVILVIITAEIFSRFLFHHSFAGIADFVAYGLLLLFFLPVGVVQMAGQQLRTEFIIERLKPKLRIQIQRLLLLLGLGLMGISLFFTVKKTISVYQMWEVSDTMLLPIFPFVVAMTVGLTFLCISMIFQFIQTFGIWETPTQETAPLDDLT